MTKLQVGTRVRAKVRTMSGWKGTGTVLSVSGNGLIMSKDDNPDDTAEYCGHEVAVMKDQMPLDIGAPNK